MRKEILVENPRVSNFMERISNNLEISHTLPDKSHASKTLGSVLFNQLRELYGNVIRTSDIFVPLHKQSLPLHMKLNRKINNCITVLYS